MRIRLLFTLSRFNPQIRQINASAQGPVWDQHHSLWAQTERDCLSALIPSTSLSFPSPSPCLSLLLAVSLRMMNCNRGNKRREKITFLFRIYIRPRDVSVMNHTPDRLRYALATHHRIKKETDLKWDGFPKQIHQKRSDLALGSVFRSGKSSNVSVNLVFQIKDLFCQVLQASNQTDHPLWVTVFEWLKCWISLFCLRLV